MIINSVGGLVIIFNERLFRTVLKKIGRYIPLVMSVISIASVQAAGDPIAGEQKALPCIGCHGPSGNSENPLFPKLAEQHVSYMVKQIMDLQTGARKHEVMSPMSKVLSEEQDRWDIAAYFAANKRVSAITPLAEKNMLGETIYYKGNDASGVVACLPCHGPAGKGSDPKVFPNIAGQHAAYVEKILRDFRSGVRTNDREKLMQNTVVLLSDEEIVAVAQYVEGLPYQADDIDQENMAPCQYPNCFPLEHDLDYPPSGVTPQGSRQRLRQGQDHWPDKH
jgi:cytochrome c553